MFCKYYRFKISSEHDSELELSATTLRHIAKCRCCHEYYNKLKSLDSILCGLPETGLDGYDMNCLNKAISARLDSTAGSSMTVKYPTVRYSNKYAAVAIMFVAVMLTFSIFVNLVENQTNLESGSGNPVCTDKTNIPSQDLALVPDSALSQPDTDSPQQVFLNPQMAIMYRLSSIPFKELGELTYQKQYQESREVYENTIKVTAKTSEVMNVFLQNNFVFMVLF